MAGIYESSDANYRAQVDPFNADKRNRVIPDFPLRRLVLPLDNVRTEELKKLRGDMLFVDRLSTGVITVKMNGQGEDAIPLAALDGIEGFPIEDVLISNTAQAGLVVNLWYGYQGRLRANSQTLTSIGTLGSITSAIDLSQDARYADDLSRAASAFITGSSVAAVAAQVSVAQLFNPVASGKFLYLDRMRCANGSANDRIIVGRKNASIGAVTNNGFNKNQSGAAGVAEYRAATSGGTAVTGIDTYYMLANTTREQVFSPPMRIPEGWGVSQETASVNVTCTFSFEWRERTT